MLSFQATKVLTRPHSSRQRTLLEEYKQWFTSGMAMAPYSDTFAAMRPVTNLASTACKRSLLSHGNWHPVPYTIFTTSRQRQEKWGVCTHTQVNLSPITDWVRIKAHQINQFQMGPLRPGCEFTQEQLLHCGGSEDAGVGEPLQRGSKHWEGLENAQQLLPTRELGVELGLYCVLYHGSGPKLWIWLGCNGEEVEDVSL